MTAGDETAPGGGTGAEDTPSTHHRGAAGDGAPRDGAGRGTDAGRARRLAPECARLAAELRGLRAATGLSLAALAERTAYSKSSWERYLNGKKPVPRQAVEALCRLSGEHPARLLALWELADAEWSGRAAGAQGTGGQHAAPATGGGPEGPARVGTPGRPEPSGAGAGGPAAAGVAGAPPDPPRTGGEASGTEAGRYRPGAGTGNHQANPSGPTGPDAPAGPGGPGTAGADWMGGPAGTDGAVGREVSGAEAGRGRPEDDDGSDQAGRGGPAEWTGAAGPGGPGTAAAAWTGGPAGATGTAGAGERAGPGGVAGSSGGAGADGAAGPEGRPGPGGAAGTRVRGAARRPGVLVGIGVAAGAVAAAMIAVPASGGFGGGGQAAPPAASSQATVPPPVGCRGVACDGRDPQSMRCGMSVRSLGTRRTAGGAGMELRYSDECRAAWARLWQSRPGDRVRIVVPGGRFQETTVEDKYDAEAYLYTPMLGASPAGLRACLLPASGGERECFTG